METTSFIYTYIVPLSGETRQPVILDVDFNPVFPGSRSKVVLLYVALSGMRQNQAGAMSSPGSFSARLLGSFNSSNLPVYTVAAPRSGDSVAQFNGLAFSSNTPFIPTNDTPLQIPRTFQIEFLPSNQRGDKSGDEITMYCTIGFRVVA